MIIQKKESVSEGLLQIFDLDLDLTQPQISNNTQDINGGTHVLKHDFVV